MNSSDTSDLVNDRFQLYRVKFWIILVLLIPALAVSIFIFVFFSRHIHALKVPQNFALLLLLIVNFCRLSFSIPLTLHFYRLGYVSPASPTYCTWWTACEYTFYVSSECLLATISIQRHMLIFNGPLLRKRYMRTLLHDLPLILCLVYPAVFYLFAIVLFPCDGTQWDFTNNLCGYADCYLVFDKVLGTFDMGVNNGVPVIIDVTANVILIIRVARQRRRLRQSTVWRQQRRMILQLFCLSGLFIVAWAPCTIVLLVQILYDPTFLLQIQMDYFFDLIDVEYLFLPWVSLAFFPELNKWVRKVFQWKPLHTSVVPTEENRLEQNRQGE